MATPQQCLVCLKSIDSSKILTNVHAKSDNALIQPQLSVFYLVNKLLGVPVDACADFLAKFGNPKEWLSVCDGCAEIVDEGQVCFNYLQIVERRHNEIGARLRRVMKVNRGQEVLGQGTAEIRAYLDNLEGAEAAEEDESISSQSYPNDEIAGPSTRRSTRLLDTAPKGGRGVSASAANGIAPVGSSDDIEIIFMDLSDLKKKANVKKKDKGDKKCQNGEEIKKQLEFEEGSVESKILHVDDKDTADSSSEDDLDLESGGDSDDSYSSGGSVKSKTKRKSKSKSVKTTRQPYKKKYPIPGQFLPNEGKCEECTDTKIQFYDFKSMENHMRFKHLDKEALKCTGCSEVFELTNRYRAHITDMRRSAPKSACSLAQTFKCNIDPCKSLIHSSKAALELHKKICHFKGPGPKDKKIINCPNAGCSKTFGTKEGLRYHIRTRHEAGADEEQPGTETGTRTVTVTVTGPFKCDHCPFVFAEEIELEAHVESHNANSQENPHSRVVRRSTRDIRASYNKK